MKPIKIAFPLLAVLILAGCGKSFLEKDNPAALTYDKFYKTEADFEAAIAEAYLQAASQSEGLMEVNEASSDNSYVNSLNSTSGVASFDFLSVSSSLGSIRDFWFKCYATITRCNMVISRLPGSTVSSQKQQVYTSEAKFLRALTYFNMVRVYGGVPLYDQEITDMETVYANGRASVEDTYAFIINDLLAAQNIDQEREQAGITNSGNRASSMAVKGLLGKVYVYNKQYGEAATLLQNLVNDNHTYDLYRDDLSNIYDPEKPINTEVIFCFNYERVSGQSCPLTFRTLPKNSQGILPNVTGDNGNGDFNIEPATYAKFEANDKRRELFGIYRTTVNDEEVEFIYSKKYLDIGANSSGSSSNFIVLRYADILLTLADALNQSGQTDLAYPYINDVRTRAGLEELPAGYTKEQMNEAIERERQLEFIMEGDRWFDLCQRGTDYLKSTLNEFFPTSNTPDAIVEDYKALFPLPSDQCDLKPGILTQNPGY